MRPYAPSPRAFADPEGEFLSYEQVRRLVHHPLPAEQTLAIPGRIEIRDAEIESMLRSEQRQVW